MMEQITDPHFATPPGMYGQKPAWAAFRCPGCGSLNLAMGAGHPGRTNSFQALMWYPEKPLEKAYPESVPAEIAGAAAEAHGCFSVGHLQAAVLMARTTIEAAAKKCGITRGNLGEKIDKLYDRKLLYEHVKDAAHEIRFAGNDAAHGDLVENPITEVEAQEILELMDMVLDGVFIAPGKTAAQKAARAARKAAAAGTEPATADVSATL